MTHSAAPKPDTRFKSGREKTGGKKPGTPNRHVSIARVEQRVYRQIDRALARHEASIDKIFEKDPLEALKLDAGLNRTTLGLLELLQQRRSAEGGAPANNRMTPAQINAAAARAVAANPTITDDDAMRAYLRVCNGDEVDALLIEQKRNELAKAAGAPYSAATALVSATAAALPVPAQSDDAPLTPQAEPLYESGIPLEDGKRHIPGSDFQERQPYPDPAPPLPVFDAQPIPDGPPLDWDSVTVVLATPVCR